MALDLHLGPDAGNAAIRAEQEGERRTPVKLLPYMDFFPQAPYASSISWVSSDRSPMVRSCFFLNASWAFTGSAETPRISVPALSNCGAQLREIDGFPGAAGGVGPRIEIDDELAALELRQRNTAAAVARQRESRGFLADLELNSHLRLPFVPFSRSMSGRDHTRESAGGSIGFMRIFGRRHNQHRRKATGFGGRGDARSGNGGSAHESERVGASEARGESPIALLRAAGRRAGRRSRRAGLPGTISARTAAAVAAAVGSARHLVPGAAEAAQVQSCGRRDGRPWSAWGWSACGGASPADRSISTWPRPG